MRLEGKVSVVTGAGSGIGEAAALRFGREGSQVVCADLDGAGAERVAAAIVEAGGEATAVTVDVSDEPQVKHLYERVGEAYGGADVVYSNAGVGSVGTALDTEMDEWNRVIGVMLTGVWLCAKHALPHMLEKGGGSIINQASIGAWEGIPGNFAYAAAKGGVLGATRQMAADFGLDRVRVNAIAPATVRTPLVEGVYRQGGGLASAESIDERFEEVSGSYLIGRIGSADEVANVALFLASDEASWVTGAVYVVDGGRSAGRRP